MKVRWYAAEYSRGKLRTSKGSERFRETSVKTTKQGERTDAAETGIFGLGKVQKFWDNGWGSIKGSEEPPAQVAISTEKNSPMDRRARSDKVDVGSYSIESLEKIQNQVKVKTIQKKTEPVIMTKENLVALWERRKIWKRRREHVHRHQTVPGDTKENKK